MATAHAPHQPADDDEAALRSLYRRLHRAMLDADTSALSALLSADFHLVHMTGYDQPRAEWLEHIASGRMRYRSSVEDSVAVELDGDLARLRGRNRVEAVIWGARGTWSLQLDLEATRTSGGWRFTAASASTN